MLLYVHRADTGVSLRLQVSSIDSILSVKEALAPWIQPHNQIMLCSTGVILENNKSLAFYGLPSNRKCVYVYDKKFIEDDALEEKTLVSPVHTPPKPPPEDLPKKKLEFVNAGTNILKLEAKFTRDLASIEALKSFIDERDEQCRQSLTEQEKQRDGFAVALLNLSEYSNHFLQQYYSFLDKYEQEQLSFQSLLDSFDEDFQRLKETELDPSMVQDGLKLLSDYVPEKDYRKWAQDCRTHHEQLKSRFKEMNIQQLTIIIDAEKKKTPDASFETMKNSLQQSSDIYYQTHKHWKQFGQDLQAVKAQVISSISVDVLTQSSPQLESFLRISHEHDSLLLLAEKSDKISKDILLYFNNSKLKLTRWLKERLRAVSTLQSKIKDLNTKLEMCEEALHRLTKQFFHQLVVVRNLPAAYHASLKEITQRKHYAHKISLLVRSFEQLLDGFHHDEVARRESVQRNELLYLPRDFIPSLSETPSRVNLAYHPSELNLPEITTETSSNLRSFEQCCDECFSQVVEIFSQDPCAVSLSLSNSTSSLMSSCSSSASRSPSPSVSPRSSSPCYQPLILADDSSSMSPQLYGGITVEELSPPLRSSSRREEKPQLTRHRGSQDDIWMRGRGREREREREMEEEDEVEEEKKKKRGIETEKGLVKAQEENTKIREELNTAQKLLKSAQEDHQLMLTKWRDERASLKRQLDEKNILIEDSHRKLSLVASSLQASNSLAQQLISSLISYKDFKHTDVILFQYKYNDIYEAVHLNTPRYFLSKESLVHFEDERKKKASILGQIIAIEEYVVVEDEYNLKPNERCHVVTLSREINYSDTLSSQTLPFTSTVADFSEI